MPYPVVSKAEARNYLAAPVGENEPTQRLPEARRSDDGPEEEWDTIGEEVATLLLKKLAENTSDGEVNGAKFESASGPAIHELLPSHPALADPEFWIWLTLHHCQDVVDKRYGPKRNLKNFGIGGAGENLLYRLWLRAEIAFNPSAKDQYELARIGDIDFWRSHVFRQGYGDVRSFARALLEFQFPKREGRKPRLKIDQIRALAKQLKRARTNLMFEVMSDGRAAQFIESEWDRLASVSA